VFPHKTDDELAAIILADAEQLYLLFEQLWGDGTPEELKRVYAAELLVCGARELYRRVLSVARKQGRNVTATEPAPQGILRGVPTC
jgi:hypothetical protein